MINAWREYYGEINMVRNINGKDDENEVRNGEGYKACGNTCSKRQKRMSASTYACAHECMHICSELIIEYSDEVRGRW